VYLDSGLAPGDGAGPFALTWAVMQNIRESLAFLGTDFALQRSVSVEVRALEYVHTSETTLVNILILQPI